MLNNRQGGRRRGRGGQRPQGGGGRPEQGNRIDNRARGNAAQLLEKYKNLARDAQMAGDRVNAEYYYQFADHYFRVLGESRARFEEQRRQRDEQDEEFEGDDGRHEAGERQDRDDRRRERGRDQERREERADEGEPRQQRQAGEGAEQRDEDDRRPRRGRPRRDRMNGGNDGDEPAGFDASVLPPSIAPAEAAADDGEEAPAPRRRTRRPRAEALPEGTPDAA